MSAARKRCHFKLMSVVAYKHFLKFSVVIFIHSTMVLDEHKTMKKTDFIAIKCAIKKTTTI